LLARAPCYVDADGNARAEVRFDPHSVCTCSRYAVLRSILSSPLPSRTRWRRASSCSKWVLIPGTQTCCMHCSAWRTVLRSCAWYQSSTIRLTTAMSKVLRPAGAAVRYRNINCDQTGTANAPRMLYVIVSGGPQVRAEVEEKRNGEERRASFLAFFHHHLFLFSSCAVSLSGLL
jgi:hypothetical protein